MAASVGTGVPSSRLSNTSAVAAAAVEAQSELVAALAQPSLQITYARDPALARALIKAAHHVGSTVADLTRGISADTVHTISQNELATNAAAVSNAVEILAAAVRAGTKSPSTALIDATRTVADATRSLLEAAKMIEDLPDEDDDDDIENFGIDAYTLQEIKVQMKIAELEHKLERARKRYDALSKTTTAATAWNVV